MIGLVEGAKRQKTPERDRAARAARGHDDHLPDRLRDARAVRRSTRGCSFSATVIVALLVCLIPTTIGGLLSAIGIAGMDRLIRHNVIPMSGRAVEAAGDVDTMLLDKTGTITLGNRMATEFLPRRACRVEELADAAQLASLADETPEGRSIVVLAKERYEPARARAAASRERARFVPVLRADAHERLRHGRPRDPQGRGRRHRAARGRARRPRAAGGRAGRGRRSRSPAARRSPSPTARACSASCT